MSIHFKDAERTPGSERANRDRAPFTVPETARASQTSPTWARIGGTEQGAGKEDRREQPAL